MDQRLKLPPKTFDVLRYLVENAGRLVTHDELLHALWRNVHVQPEVLKSHVLAIRTALGDKTEAPRFIETQRGRGYRFVGPINCASDFPRPADDSVPLGCFAGRAEPMAGLLGLLHRAAACDPQVAFVSGEPGVGKTTLIEQFLGQTTSYPDLGVAKGRCIEGFAGAESYYPVLEALGSLCKGPNGVGAIQALVTLAPSWASQMPAQVPVEQRALLNLQAVEGAQRRMVREAASLIEALAMERPLILILEDLHWADYATIDLLSAICRRRSAARLLIIATYRLEDLKTARHPLKRVTRELSAHGYCTEVELGPLPEPAIADILKGADGKSPSAAFTRFIHERSGGNPLFMRITLDHLAGCGMVARETRGWRPLTTVDKLARETPPTLGRLIESRVEGMTDEQQLVLEAACVAGVHFDTASVAPAADMDEQSFEAICEELARRTSFIRRGEERILPNHAHVRPYAFNHAIYRQILYDRIGPARRAHLHRAIGVRLEEIYSPDQRNDLAARLAQHFAFARDWPKALDYLRSALRIANSRSARRDALVILDRAAELAAGLPDGARIPAEIEFLERRAAIQAATHDRKAGETYAKLAEMAARHRDTAAQIRGLLGLSFVLSWHDLDGSLRVLGEVLDLSDKADPNLQDYCLTTAPLGAWLESD
ncbi:ATP-binding protein [Bradyrhizobium canariense]|nr:AAA family ATPase [Bradyrhizobium canariense]